MILVGLWSGMAARDEMFQASGSPSRDEQLVQLRLAQIDEQRRRKRGRGCRGAIPAYRVRASSATARSGSG